MNRIVMFVFGWSYASQGGLWLRLKWAIASARIQ